jgi:hypothetical protein
VLFCICLADKNMVTFTREDRRGHELEFHSQGMGTREIAKDLLRIPELS